MTTVVSCGWARNTPAVPSMAVRVPVEPAADWAASATPILAVVPSFCPAAVAPPGAVPVTPAVAPTRPPCRGPAGPAWVGCRQGGPHCCDCAGGRHRLEGSPAGAVDVAGGSPACGLLQEQRPAGGPVPGELGDGPAHGLARPHAVPII